jgi:hypothetical protein
VFVGNAWDPQPGRETPWIDLARQLAGEAGVAALGPAALTAPRGTEAIQRAFSAANAPVLLLFDEVLNFLNRHRNMAEAFHAFVQNLTVAVTGTTHGAVVISLPRSQVEMTDWDWQWQERITKVVRRVAKDLIVNDEAEIGEVVRRRLFEDLRPEQTRRKVAKEFSDWCFERRAQLPPEWTAVDSSLTEAKAREFLQRRFEACYLFHPATLSVFQRKWQALPQYQQTRGTLAMLAQWVALAAQDGFRNARKERLITLGSAPLSEASFRSVVLGQLGESRLVAAIEADIAGEHSHARALDADIKDALSGIHRRVGTAILFESSGGQTDKVAHLPELRFALGEPDIDTTSIDNAAFALEERCYFVRRVGSDGFRIGYQPTLKKVVSDRRASLDEEKEVKPAMRKLVEEEFRRGASVPVIAFPADSAGLPDAPKLTLVLADPELEWSEGDSALRAQLGAWTKQRGGSPRLYPGALIWCLKKPGRELRDKVELMLAWKRVAREVADGVLGSDLGRGEREELQTRVKEVEAGAREEVWGSYRFVALADSQALGGLKVIDLGAGHSSSSETLCGRVLSALKSQALLNESIGAGYLERNWPPAFKESGAWPLASLRQSFLNGALTRLLDPDATLRAKIVEFVKRGDFGLASGQKADGGYERMWFREPVGPDKVSFEAGVFLLLKATAERLKGEKPAQPLSSPAAPMPTFAQVLEPSSALRPDVPRSEATSTPATVEPAAASHTLRITGSIPSESWNRFGTSLLSKLRAHQQKIEIEISLSATVPSNMADSLVTELRQILSELGLANSIRIG